VSGSIELPHQGTSHARYATRQPAHHGPAHRPADARGRRTTAPPPFPKTAEDRKAFAETVCSEIDARAAEHALPQAFMARLIWKEACSILAP